MSGVHGGGSFAGSGGFSVDINGAGNLNGKAVIDGSFSGGEQNEDEEVDNQNDYDREDNTEVGEEMINGNDFGLENSDSMDYSDAPIGSHQFDNVNSQAAINQYGMGNTNKQGGITQQVFRRQNKTIHQLPKQHIVCGYHYKTIYPGIQPNVENDAIQQSFLNDQSVGQYTMRRFYSGPFNHLL